MADSNIPDDHIVPVDGPAGAVPGQHVGTGDALPFAQGADVPPSPAGRIKGGTPIMKLAEALQLRADSRARASAFFRYSGTDTALMILISDRVARRVRLLAEVRKRGSNQWTRAGTPAGRGSNPCFTTYVQHGNSRITSAYNARPRIDRHS